MTTVSIWTSMCRKTSLPEALRELCACGWTAFECSTEHLCRIETDADPEGRIGEALECAGELGASMPQAHGLLAANVADPDAARRQEDLGRLERHIGIAARLGARVIVIHPGGRQGYTTRAERRRITELNVEAFRRLGDLAGERGMKIGLENTMSRVGATPCDLLDLLDDIGHPALGVTFDTSHASVQGLDIPGAIRELGPHLVGTHLSDNDGSGDQHRFPGCGRIDWPAAMRALAEAGYEGPVNLEIPGECHAEPELRRMKVRFARELAGWLAGMLA